MFKEPDPKMQATRRGILEWFCENEGDREKPFGCDKAGLSHCRVHGLRKAAAAGLAELGCTESEMMSIIGQLTFKEVTRYTKTANQKSRAASALVKLTGERN